MAAAQKLSYEERTLPVITGCRCRQQIAGWQDYLASELSSMPPQWPGVSTSAREGIAYFLLINFNRLDLQKFHGQIVFRLLVPMAKKTARYTSWPCRILGVTTRIIQDWIFVKKPLSGSSKVLLIRIKARLQIKKFNC